MVLIYLIGGVAAIIAIASGAFYFNDARRMTSFTTGQVVHCDERLVVINNARQAETEIVARYTAAGREYEIRRVLRGAYGKRYPAGGKINVRYNPAEPDMADLAA